MPRREDGSPPTRLEWVTALAITVTGIGLYVVFATHAGSLWRDEVNSIETASASSWREVWRRLEFESFPAGWIGLLRLWLLLGGVSDAALRVAGAVGGLGVMAAVWVAMWKLGRTVPLISVALLAVNPEIVRWSASVRAWGVGAALAVVAVALLRDATAHPSRWRIAAAGIASILSVHCVYQNAGLLAAAVVAACIPPLASRDWRRAAVPLGIGAVALASLVPYARVILRRRDWDALNQSAISIGDLSSPFANVLGASGPVVTIVWSALLGVVVVAAAQAHARDGIRRYALTVLMLSFAIVVAIYLGFSYPTRPWYYLALVVLAAVAGEIVVSSWLRAQWVSLIRVGTAVIVLIAGFSATRTALAVPQSNVGLVAEALERRARAGDLVLASPWYNGVSLTRYWRGAAEIHTIPPLRDVRVHRYDLLKAAMLSPSPLDPLFARLQAVLSGGGSVWVVAPVGGLPWSAPHSRLAPPPLETTGWQSGRYEWNWICATGAFLSSHASSATPIPLAEKGGPFEDLTLVQLRGWR